MMYKTKLYIIYTQFRSNMEITKTVIVQSKAEAVSKSVGKLKNANLETSFIL